MTLSGCVFMLQEREVCTLTDAAYRMWQPQTFRERSNGRPLEKRALVCLPPWSERKGCPVTARRFVSFQALHGTHESRIFIFKCCRQTMGSRGLQASQCIAHKRQMACGLILRSPACRRRPASIPEQPSEPPVALQLV